MPKPINWSTINQELEQARQERVARNQWGLWSYDSVNEVYEHATYGYYVDRERTKDIGEIIDWILHLYNKSWITGDDLWHLMQCHRGHRGSRSHERLLQMAICQDVTLTRYHSIKDVATSLAVTPRTIWQLVRSGQLPAVKVAGVWRIAEDELQLYLAGHSNQRPAPRPAALKMPATGRVTPLKKRYLS